MSPEEYPGTFLLSVDPSLFVTNFSKLRTIYYLRGLLLKYCRLDGRTWGGDSVIGSWKKTET